MVPVVTVRRSGEGKAHVGRPHRACAGTNELAQAQACSELRPSWRSRGYLQRQTTPQAAPGSGEPRPISCLSGTGAQATSGTMVIDVAAGCLWSSPTRRPPRRASHPPTLSSPRTLSLDLRRPDPAVRQQPAWRELGLLQLLAEHLVRVRRACSSSWLEEPTATRLVYQERWPVRAFIVV
eukprot:scaffold33656_cov54-Phaeocystis_antarctica.AAC.1